MDATGGEPESGHTASGQSAESGGETDPVQEPEPALPPALRLLIEAGIEREAAEALTTIDPEGSAPLTTEQSDAIEVVGDAIRSLAVQLAAAEHRMLVLIAAFDRHGGWKPGGHRDCAHWLSFFTGMDLGTARQRLRTAHALTNLPVVAAAMSRGELSYSKARAIGRLEEELQSEEAQEAWVELAVRVAAHELESRVRMARQLQGRTEEELERARLRRRRFSIFPDENGMYELRGKVTADVGQMLMQVIEAATDVLFHADGRDWSPNGDGRTVRIEEIKPEQRRADALWLIAERIMEVGFEGEEAAEGEGEAVAPRGRTRSRLGPTKAGTANAGTTGAGKTRAATARARWRAFPRIRSRLFPRNRTRAFPRNPARPFPRKPTFVVPRTRAAPTAPGTHLPDAALLAASPECRRSLRTATRCTSSWTRGRSPAKTRRSRRTSWTGSGSRPRWRGGSPAADR
jgi:hypothetical protein